VSIYKRGSVYWYKFMWNGESIRRSTKQSSGTVARQMEAAHRTSLAKGEVGIKEKKLPPSLGEFCKNRLEPWAKSTFEQTVPKSFDWYRTNLRIIQASSLSSLRLDKVMNEQVAQFADQQLKKGYAVASVNSTIRVLRRALRLATEWAIIEKTPKLAKLSGENHRDHVVTREEEERYYSACERDPKNAIQHARFRELAELMRLLFETGLRPDEAYSLCWESVNWSSGVNGTIFVKGGKTAAARRTVPMSPVLKFVLEGRWQRNQHPAEGWIWPAATKSGHADSSTFKLRHKIAIKNSKVRPFVVLFGAAHFFDPVG
jgi:integrase